ncbi:hypothetical protein J2S13_001025 [Oikeobacillus pervagus]|uniref:DUF2536 family protein n=1 Tax=Oikeobacillus pervagus TaxID=1325931 RepID=A0AAJ1T2C7_9BACI|nr:DUF2536 family protein [Oikeobacillus pervagus]MDQ0214629.1 hypothetical protein [Oikeobacillus pervagus]
MHIELDLIEDKIEWVEADDLNNLEKKVNEKIEQNRAILLSVHSVSHQLQFDPDGKKHYSAVVHFKRKF